MPNKTVMVTLRLTQQQHSALTQEAVEAGLSLGALIRQRLGTQVRPDEILAEVRRVGQQQARLWLATAQDDEARAEIQRICSGSIDGKDRNDQRRVG